MSFFLGLGFAKMTFVIVAGAFAAVCFVMAYVAQSFGKGVGRWGDE